MFQGSLAVATQMLMSEEAYAVPGLRAALGRLANSVVAVLGPELSPGTDVYTKCKALIREVQVGLHNIKLLSRQSMLACCTFQVLNMTTTSAVMLSSSRSQNVPIFTEMSILQRVSYSEKPRGQ